MRSKGCKNKFNTSFKLEPKQLVENDGRFQPNLTQKNLSISMDNDFIDFDDILDSDSGNKIRISMPANA